MWLLALLPASIIWIVGRNSFARLFGARVRHVLFLDGPTPRRVLATLGGSLSSALLASALMLILFELGGAIDSSPVPTVGAVVEGMPAAMAGLERGDQILTIGGAPVKSLGDVGEMINRTQGKPVAVDVLRGGERHEVTVRALQDGERYRIGAELAPRYDRVMLPFGESARRAARFPLDYSRELFASLARALAPRPAELSGPIGIVRVVRPKQDDVTLDLLFSLPAMGAVEVAWLGLPIGFLLLLAGRGRAREAGA